MSRATLFNSPLLLGFDQLERALDRMNKSAGDGYPPDNVEQIDEGRLRITLAVAGFSERDLSVQIENNQLVIRGEPEPEAEDRVRLRRGIAARQRQRAVVLADGIEVQPARLNNGRLHTDLQRPIETASVRRITIEKDSGARSPLDSKKLP